MTVRSEIIIETGHTVHNYWRDLLRSRESSISFGSLRTCSLLNKQQSEFGVPYATLPWQLLWNLFATLTAILFTIN